MIKEVKISKLHLVRKVELDLDCASHSLFFAFPELNLTDSLVKRLDEYLTVLLSAPVKELRSKWRVDNSEDSF